VATTAVSSAKAAVVDLGEVGRSVVYSRCNNGPRTLWVRQHSLGRVLCIQFQPLRGSVCYVNRILGEGNNSEGETVLTFTESSMPYYVESLRVV
jgi:hypothetical protein